MVDWAEVAEHFWGDRFEKERVAGLKSKDFKVNYFWRTMNVMSYGYRRDADCKRAAERIANFGRCMREAGLIATLDERYRQTHAATRYR